MSQNETFGQYMRTLREEKGLMQKEAEKHARMSKGLLGLIELDRFNQWGQGILERISRLYGKSVMELRKRLPPQILKLPKSPLGKILLERRLELYLTREEVAVAIGRDYRYVAALERGDILGLQSREIPPLAAILRLDESKLTPFFSVHQHHEILPRHQKLKRLVSEPGIRQKKTPKRERVRNPRPQRPAAKVGRPSKIITLPKPKPEPQPKVQKVPAVRVTTPVLPLPATLPAPVVQVVPKVLSDREFNRMNLFRELDRARKA